VARTLGRLAAIGVDELKGVGAERAKALAELGIISVLDLLQHYPRRYIDRTAQVAIRDLREGDEALVLAKVVRSNAIHARGRGKARVEVTVNDGSGHLKVTFFNQTWRQRQLSPGTEAAFFGKVTTFRGSRQMTNPVVDLFGDQTGRIVAVYPQSDKARVYSRDFARWIDEALERAGEFAEPLPDAVRARHQLTDRTSAFRDIHAPEAMADQAEARRRLVFDELLRVQLALVMRKRALERTAKGIRHDVSGELVRRFHEALPFPLTAAQQRTIAEISDDLAGPHPMHRLLQGDVGAGKTVVAVSALLVAVQGGHQGALMAPTEVLAEQHFMGVRDLLSDLTVPDPSTLMGDRPLRVELLTNRTTPTERKRLAADLATGGVDLLIGTHALIQEGVGFRSLGVVVIDEQHRFGVEQRAALRGKGDDPDVLVMTATPIPRTAAMTVYGDLDVSILDELPPGRTPIVTSWARTPMDETLVWDRVREEVAAGRQAYVVCPLIEESDKLEVASAQETYDRLSAPGGELADLSVGLLHGRIPPREKEATMDLFRRGQLQVLVATTVIEVGVDVPNATVMVILDADRFGIAQLHQLRGRVGRGAAQSWCYLVGEATTGDGEARLEAMVRTTDGFELAEVDLEIRGEGTIMGERQKGRSDLRLASLRRDKEWVVKAREAAFAIVDSDARLDANRLLADEVRLLIDDDEAEFLFKS